MSMIPAGDEHNRCRKALANKGADVNIPDENGETPLMYAVKEGHNLCVNELIKAGADVNQCGPCGSSALIIAAYLGLPNIVHLLLASGADVNMKDEGGKQALNYAADRIDQVSSIEMLLKAGADVNNRDTEGLTPLMVAVSNSEDHSVKEDPDIVNSVNMLINAGADVNDKTIDGRTALAFAAVEGYEKCIQSLLEAGAHVNAAKDKDGVTALMMASHGCYHRCVNILLAAGADVNATDNDGGNALHLPQNYMFCEFVVAIMKRYPRKIISLLRAGIHINQFRKSQGKNALGVFLEHRFKYKKYSTKVNFKEATMILYAAGETLEGASDRETLKGVFPDTPE